MIYLDGMGPRQSMAVEILDTVRFGGLDKIKGANGYRKQKLDRSDAYVIPFGLSKDCYGVVVIKTPKNIDVAYRVNGLDRVQNLRYTDEVKRFLVKRFIQE
jgi:hypothetical protein